MRRVLIVSLVGFSQAASAQGDAAPVIAPTSGWVLDYGADRCRIVRSFGEGEAKSVVYFEQTEPASQLDWVVAGKRFRTVRSNSKVSVQFGPGNPSFELEHRGATLGELGEALSYTGFERRNDKIIPMSDPQAIQQNAQERAISPRALVLTEGAEVEWLEIQPKRGEAVRFALGNMQPVYEAMNACMADLMTHWGLDPERELQRVSGPIPMNLTIVARNIQRNYPSSALASGSQAMIAARVLVDAKGNASDCAIIDLTVAEKFGDGVCRQFTDTARFDPAVDANGAPMPSYYVARIRYEIQ